MVIGIIVVVALVLLMVSRLGRFYGSGLPRPERKPADLSAFSQTDAKPAGGGTPTQPRPGASHDDRTE